MLFFLFFLIHMLITAKLVYWYPSLGRTFKLIDVPNERSSHSQPTPRGAGMMFLFVWSLGSCWGLSKWFPGSLGIFLPLIVCALVIGVLGFVDDRFGLSAKFRFLVQCLVMASFLWPYWDSLGNWFSFGVLIFLGVWSINLYNFMDGIDGISGIEGISILGTLGFLALATQNNAQPLALISFGLTGSLFGFLFFNLPKAKVFMGDVGSTTLGFIMAALAVIAHWEYGISLGYMVLLYSVFWVDATLTLLRRIRAGETWYHPHRKHAYQRLYHGARWSHGKILIFVAGVNGILMSMAYMMQQGMIPLSWGLIISGLGLMGYFGYTEKVAPFSKA